ncbi:MAG: hypothetical protein Ct9H300mP28_05500 [Pseudomonadota bacterium]|nr:MAG: hypothetical protein Ct9H300mP28_05500 [Pseudomonadota bacterium]
MELLAPAGNLNKLKIAVLYGADAVYLAGPKYGLRVPQIIFQILNCVRGFSSLIKITVNLTLP